MNMSRAVAFRRATVFFMFFVCSVCAVSAFGSRDTRQNDNTFVIRGSVLIVGNEPHTAAVIKTKEDKKIYAIAYTEREKEIRDLQGYIVDFKVTMVDPKDAPPWPPADGMVSILSWKIIK